MMRSSIAAEKGIVKVIHPGRYVEILKEPVTAAEVMRKNPRHCLTRPDVFKFPWIVIKPDTVLPPGKVFLLVPNRTLYDLMKSENHRLPRQQTVPPHREKRVNAAEKNKTPPPSSSPPKAFAGMTPKHRARHNPSLNCRNNKPNDSSEKERGGEAAEAKPYWLDNRNTYEEFRRYLAAEAESGAEDLDSEAISDLRAYNKSTSRDHRDYDRRRERRNGNNLSGVVLKSCLKKPESDRRSVGLSVSFAAPLTGKGKETQSSADYMLRNGFNNLRIS